MFIPKKTTVKSRAEASVNIQEVFGGAANQDMSLLNVNLIVCPPAL
jgi:hypothetical protein